MLFPACCPPEQLDADDASKGTLEMNPLWIAVNRDVTLGRKGSWYEVPIAAKLGATYLGALRGLCAPCTLCSPPAGRLRCYANDPDCWALQEVQLAGWYGLQRPAQPRSLSLSVAPSGR